MESSISISGRWGKVKQVVLGDLVSAVHYSRWLKSTLIEAGWAPCLVFIVHVFVHVTFNAYEAYPPLDRPVHFLGGFVIAFFFHRASINASRYGILGPFHPTTHVILVFSLVCSTTVFWEFGEFLYDHVFDTQHQLGLNDTLLDMLLGILGGLTFLMMMGITNVRTIKTIEGLRNGEHS